MAQSGGWITQRGTAIVLGSGLAVAGVGIVAMAIWRETGLHAPRWVVGSFGGAFLVVGAWTAVCYALGYDPKHPQAGHPPPRVQVSFLLPGIILFAAPFHWVAFGVGPQTGCARVLFGLGAIMMDVLIIVWPVQTLRRGRRPKPDRVREGAD